jgi:HlyD family secretion protein
MAKPPIIPQEGGSQVVPYQIARPAQPTVREMGFSTTLRIGLLIILVFVVGFGAWAALAPLESAAIASGEIIVEGDRRTVEHLEGGIVAKILVHDGAVVEAGALVIQLDDTQAKASVGVLTTRMTYAVALEARLEAERDGATALKIPNWVKQRAETDASVHKVLNAQRNIFRSRAESMDAQLAILENRKEQFGEEIIGLEAEVEAIDQELGHIRSELQDISGLVRKNLAPRARLYSLQRQEAEILGRRGRNIAAIARARQSIAEADLRGTSMRTESTEQAIRELRDVQGEIADLRERLSAARDVLARTAIVAPVSGIVVNLKVHTTNSIISRAEPLMEIVPVGESRVIRARIDPIDIDVVRTGLPANVRLTAFSARTTPELKGEVINVSADRLIDEKTGVTFYRARIRLNDGELDKVKGLHLSPGMPVEVMISTGQTTLLNYLMQPFTDLIRRGVSES